MRIFELRVLAAGMLVAAAAAAETEPGRDALPEEREAGVTWDAALNFDVTSGYLLYGALFDSQPCAQTGVEGGGSCGGWGRLGLGAWSNSDLTGRRRPCFPRAFNENDFYIHYGNRFGITDDIAFSLRLMHMWYWYPHTSKATGKGCSSKREIYVIGSLENPWIVPYGMVTHEWLLTGGTYLELGLRRGFEIADGLTLTPVFSGNWLSRDYMTIFPAPADGLRRSCAPGMGCLRLALMAEYAVTENFSLRARIDYVSLVNDEVRRAVDAAVGSTYEKDFVWGSVGFTVRF